MTKLNTLFDQFLSNINPDEKAVEYAQTAHERVRACLEKEDGFKQYVTDTFLYGSYKRQTAVGDIKDVDIVVLTNFDTTDPENTPQKVLRKLKAALVRCYEDADNPEYQRRSIRVNDPLPDNHDAQLTLDVIPAAIETNDEAPLLVPDRELKKWIRSHPKGHLNHTTELNADECSKGRFVPLVKLMKWWWRYQCETKQPDVERPKPKGFWIECLTAENFDPKQTAWADHFIVVLENVLKKYANPTKVPELRDPGLQGETIKTSMTLVEFKTFLGMVEESLQQAKLARDEADDVESSGLWRDLFGTEFPLHDAEETVESRKSAGAVTVGPVPHAQKPIWPLATAKKVKIDAYLFKEEKRLSGINSDGRQIPSGLDIKYVASTNVKGNYEVWWQVVNTGEHARLEKGLRGEFFKSTERTWKRSKNPLINWESTSYTGKHWIECFIVKDGVCVARSGRFFISIRNPQYP